MFEAISQDLKHAARRLAKNLGFSAAVIATLALGMGATTAIFSVVYGVLLRPLPYPEPDRLVAIWEVNHRGHPLPPGRSELRRLPRPEPHVRGDGEVLRHGRERVRPGRADPHAGRVRHP